MNNRPVKMASGESGPPRGQAPKPLVLFAQQHLGDPLRNVTPFLARDFQWDGGTKALVECFYRSIRENAPVPIPYREILLTSSIMDSIFDQLRDRGPDQLAASRYRLISSTELLQSCSTCRIKHSASVVRHAD